MNKQMILGIPWLSEENPHIDWAQGAIAVQQGQKWISLPLAKPKRNIIEHEDHLAYYISENRISPILRSKVMDGAFLGYIRLAEEEESMVLEVQGSTAVKPKWDPALPKDVHVVLEEFDDVCYEVGAVTKRCCP